MQQIEIDMICPEPLELDVEELFEVRLLLDEPDRHLIGEEDLFPVAVRESHLQQSLALSVVVAERRVDIVDAGIDRVTDEAYRLRLVYRLVGIRRESHTSVAEGGYFDAGEYFAVFHGILFPFVVDYIHSNTKRRKSQVP